MKCEEHCNHGHVHHEHCGHPKVQHDGHVDYLHDGHLHHAHHGHYDEHQIAVSAANPDGCHPVSCACGGHEGCGHPTVSHGDHLDYLIDGRLHHKHGDHCDDHGPVTVVA